MSGEAELSGPDLARGVSLTDLPEGGQLLGRSGGEAVLLTRRGEEIFAIGATCTHYGGPLAEGLMVGETVRCPWHHGCFSLRTGQPLRPPALNDLSCWDVAVRDGMVRVGAKRQPAPRPSRRAKVPESVVIVGGGAAGEHAAETLRREGYEGPVTI